MTAAGYQLEARSRSGAWWRVERLFRTPLEAMGHAEEFVLPLAGIEALRIVTPDGEPVCVLEGVTGGLAPRE